ncbi:chitin disaccharide deacetylase [Vibrio alginolyticus]|uniref:chitin disaccharide deacetylase n=1 Tax=Vibrio alginolyticus TaxID=663 RepID=UPI0003116D37|nr:chitin disaccharide deacetylase [Vibrio alginolyticus]EGQ7844578.1 chitin disaccharide deacetylase [Vibrio alginolyticus]EGQ8986136.1 chitin disaccharide deacetylase [Vibrio alginolyticus]EGR0306713.1 chitin disaccharide deacetylase [Vibrio alginolyticus]EHK5086787.1 chitin disaccharide deacetylase [Vibrio alginolyticus]EJN3802441.1 chitin disaccharide deacetylase [Vibrio alginolyticus]
MKVIFNADDFGLTRGVNSGIVKAHQQGVVHSTTMMVSMDAEQHALELARHNPDLKIGVHLRFTAGVPITKHPNLTNGRAHFINYDELWSKQDFETQVVYDEAKAQVEHFLSLGLELSHLDSHHHAHTHPQILPVIKEVANEYRVPLRGTGLCQESMTIRYIFTDEFYDQKVSLDGLMAHLLSLKADYDLVEVMCHPAEADQALILKSGYALQRELELQVLTSPILKEQLAHHGITVTDYSELVSTNQTVGV